MRRLTTSTTCFVALLIAQPTLADTETDKAVAAETSSAVVENKDAVAAPAASVTNAPAPDASAADAVPAADAADASTEPEMQKSGKLSHDEICQMIESAANGEALPFEFLARLIWQESKFNPQAVSRVGAQGIA